jgi:hypothetical protein
MKHKTTSAKATGLVVSADSIDLHDVMGHYVDTIASGTTVYVALYETDRAPISTDRAIAAQAVDAQARFVFSMVAPRAMKKCYVGVHTDGGTAANHPCASAFVADGNGMLLDVAYVDTVGKRAETAVGDDTADEPVREVFTSSSRLLRARGSCSSGTLYLQVHAMAAADLVLASDAVPVAEIKCASTEGLKELNFGREGRIMSVCSIAWSTTTGVFTAASIGTTTTYATYRAI